MAATATNESWKPGPVIAHGSSASTAAAAQREQVPGVARRSDQPGQRHEHAGGRRAHDRRPASDDRGVGGDRRDRAPVGERARHPGDPGESEHRCDQQDDVAARHGQQMREPGRAERLQRLVVERRGAAQRDARRDARRLVVAARRERRARAAAQPVEHALDAAPPPDLRERARRQRLVNALARQPGTPVEVAARRRHRRERAADHDDRALLAARRATRSSTGWPFERAIAELPNGPARRLARDDDARRVDVPDERAQRIGGALRDAVRRPGRAQRARSITAATAIARGEAGGACVRTSSASTTSARPSAPDAGQRGQGQPDRQPGRGRDAELVDAGCRASQREPRAQRLEAQPGRCR